MMLIKSNDSATASEVKPKRAIPFFVIIAVVVMLVAISIFNLSKDATVPEINDVGDNIEFGTWRGEPITWRVLDIDSEHALLISEDILAVRQYEKLYDKNWSNMPASEVDRENECVTWADCEVREWLNDDFLNNAFTKREQNVIGKNAYDKLFFLSIDEAYKYFNNNDDRVAKFVMAEEDIKYILSVYEYDLWFNQDQLITQEKELREYFLNQKQVWEWWLRSPGEDNLSAAFVSDSGYVDSIGYSVMSFYQGVRPAMYIKMNG